MIKKTWVRPLAYFAVYVGWGTTYLAIRVGVQSFAPATFLGIRFMIAALALAPILAAQRAWKGLERRQIRDSALQGIMLLVAGLLPVAYAERSLASNVTAIVIGCTPIAFALFDRVLNGTPIRRTVVLGFVFGFLGVALLSLMGASGGAQGGVTLRGLAFVLCGFMSWSFGSVVSRSRLQPVTSPLANVFVQYLAAALVLAVIALGVEGFTFGSLASCTRAGWVSLLYIALLPSLLSYTAYIWLLRNEPSARVSTYAFVNPIVAVAAGALVLGEPASPAVVGALALVITGTWLNFRKAG